MLLAQRVIGLFDDSRYHGWVPEADKFLIEVLLERGLEINCRVRSWEQEQFGTATWTRGVMVYRCRWTMRDVDR